jgi:hypothetical protein
LAVFLVKRKAPITPQAIPTSFLPFPALSRRFPPILGQMQGSDDPSGHFLHFSADFRRFLVKCKALMIPQGIPATFPPISADFLVKCKAPMIPQGVPTPFSAGFRRFPPISADFGS